MCTGVFLSVIFGPACQGFFFAIKMGPGMDTFVSLSVRMSDKVRKKHKRINIYFTLAKAPRNTSEATNFANANKQRRINQKYMKRSRACAVWRVIIGRCSKLVFSQQNYDLASGERARAAVRRPHTKRALSNWGLSTLDSSYNVYTITLYNYF